MMKKFLASLFIVFVLLVSPMATAQTADTSETDYSRNADYLRRAELPPLRISYSDLQTVLDRVTALINRANGTNFSLQESIEIRNEELQITISGHQIKSDNAKIPMHMERFGFHAYAKRTTGLYPVLADIAPISSITLECNDYQRELIVKGKSPEQVDAVISLIKDDLSKSITHIGGLFFRNMLLTIAMALLMLFFPLCMTLYEKSKRRIWLLLMLVSVILAVILGVLVWFSNLFPGYSAVQGDADLTVLYGPEIAVGSLLVGVFTMPLSYLISEILGNDASKITKNS